LFYFFTKRKGTDMTHILSFFFFFFVCIVSLFD
jgi:hypothetical protein